MALSLLKSFIIGIISGLIIFYILSLINQQALGALLGFFVSGLIITLFNNQELPIYLRILPGAVIGFCLTIFAFFIEKYPYESYYAMSGDFLAFLLVFTIFLFLFLIGGAIFCGIGSLIGSLLK